MKFYNWHWFIAGLLPVDALPPCQSCQPLDVGPHFPRGYMGICQVQVCRGHSSRCSRIKIGIPQWGVQRGWCADWGADRKGVGQLLPAHPEQGESFLFREYLSDFAWVCPRWCCFYIKPSLSFVFLSFALFFIRMKFCQNQRTWCKTLKRVHKSSPLGIWRHKLEKKHLLNNNFDGHTGLPFKSLGFGEDGQAKAKGWWPSAEREARVNEGYLFHFCCKGHNLHHQHRILAKLHQQLRFE